MLPGAVLRPARADWARAGGVALALFVLYAATAPRTVALEDDGLFILSSYFLGIEHPPGFPLYTLLGKLFTLLPLGSVAYRAHLMSALFGGLACGLLWMVARLLVEGRLAAYVAAFGLGLTPVFWSQSVIAEVYTLNACFFLGLALLGLHASPRVLPWMALLFGLSLSNHWPLMLLGAPALAVLLWPMRADLLRRFGALSWLVILGLLPYVWLVRRSWMAVPISFDGPLESLPEIWYFLSRAGYAAVDHSPTANWLDRLHFFRFLGAQLLVQFAVLGTLLAAVGAWVQWRLLERRVAAFLTVAFLMPTVVLLMMLGFDYDSVSKHVFHVYPLPAYAVAALWMGLGLVWLASHVRARPAHAATAGALVLAVIAAVGVRTNIIAAETEWAARYARAVLDTLPKDAILFVHGDADLPPIAYLHMVEGVRPDITLYHTRGLILGNRLFHPLRSTEEQMNAALTEFIRAQTAPVFFTENFGMPLRTDHWLHLEVAKTAADRGAAAGELAAPALRFLEESVLADTRPSNAWVAHMQGELRRRYGVYLGRRLPRGQPPGEADRRRLAALVQTYQGAMGLAEGVMANPDGYAAGVVGDLLARAQDLMPSDVRKVYRAKYFYLRGALRLDLNDRPGAIGDFELAISLWPDAANQAVKPLQELYREAGNEAALKTLEARVKRRR